MRIEPLSNENIKATVANKAIYFLLCSALVWTTLFYGAVRQPIIALFYLVVVLIMICWAIDAYMSGVFRFNKSLLPIPILATAIYGIIQIIPFGSFAEIGGVSGISRTISLDSYLTKLTVVHFFALFLFFSAFAAFADSFKRLRKLVLIITIFGFIYAFFAILQSFLSPGKIFGMYELDFAKPFGTFVNRHNFAAFMEMSIAIPLGLLFVGAIEKDKRLLYVTAVGLMGIALILSGSRGGLVAFLAEIFLLVLLTAKSNKTGSLVLKGVMAIALIGVIVAGAVLIGGESSLTRVTESATSGDITSQRTQIWSVTIDVIKENLPLGAGIGAFGVAYTPFDDLNGMGRVEQAHNDYLEVLANAGIVGLILGVGFLVLFFRTALRNIKTKNIYRKGVAVGAFAGCFAILVHSLFDFVLHVTAISLMFIALMSMLIVSRRKSKDDEDLYIPKRRKKRKAVVTSIEDRKELKGAI